MNREEFETALKEVEEGVQLFENPLGKKNFVIQYITAHAPRENRIWTSRQLWLLFGKAEK